MITTIWSSDPLVPTLAKQAAEGVYAIRPFAVYGDTGPGIEKITKFLTEDNRDPATVINSAYVQGWLAGEVVLTALRSVEGPVTGEKLKTALEGLTDVDTGELSAPLSYSATSHMGVSDSAVYQIRNGEQVLVS
ncbi:ABC transporter substrate-binding protein [Pseudonocardia sp. H11422]|uniref:ABC transporter substrate-binding protein n=1 Tax=Pseudonocardia sp. H11422 TaxID=2835866 RepID=UPI001BDCC444|nr:ABC transporter substrate-binding protein [Pseudonocardia sp. H11422]